MRRFRQAVAALCAAGLLAGLTACGGVGKSDGTLRVAQDLNLGPGPWFDPAKFPAGLANWMTLMYGAMVYQTDKGLQPGLATKWDFPDAQTMVLTLRQGVKFQDGTTFDAAAVKFSWDRVIASKTMVKTPAVAAMTSVDVDNPYQVTVHLSAPVTGAWRDRFLTNSDSTAVVSPTAVQKQGANFGSAPIDAGAGPYKFVSYTPGQKIVLEAWDGYWQPADQKLKRIELTQVAPGAATVTALVGRNVDMATVNPSDVAALKAQGLDVDATFPASYASEMLFSCMTKGPLATLPARQALAAALDRNGLNQSAFAGLGKPTASYLSQTSPYYSDVPMAPYDAARAKQLAAQSGLAGQTLTLEIQSDPVSQALGQVLQSQLAAAGVNVKINAVASTYLSDPTDMPDLMLQLSYLSAVGDAYIQGGSLGTGNWCHNNAPATQTAWKRVLAPQPESQLKSSWATFQTAALNDLFLIPLVMPPVLLAHGKNVKVGDTTQSLGIGSIPGWSSVSIG